MQKISRFFVPLCGLFGLVAGHFLWGGGRYTLIGMGAGFLVGVLFRLYVQHKPK